VHKRATKDYAYIITFFSTSLTVGQSIPLKEVSGSGFQALSIALMGREGQGTWDTVGKSI